MSKDIAIPKKTVIDALKELSDYDFQIHKWISSESFSCFIEAVNTLFDDASITFALENNEIVFSKRATLALIEVGNILESINEFRPEIEIIHDPKMQVVRDKAAEALALVLASDGSESTVEIIED